MNKNLFCFWTGDNLMPSNRIVALKTLTNTELNIVYLNKNNLQNWIKNDCPLHKSYENLSAVHRADYLRVYFMHNYGGGYCDIKNINNSWLQAYNELNNNKEKFAVGYPEIGWKGVSRVGGFEYLNLLLNCDKLIGNCAYIFKPKTEFTTEWLDKTNELLDSLSSELIKFPASVPEDFKGKKIDGTVSKYPLKWSQLLGDIFHPLCYKYRNKILKSLPMPDFLTDYDS
jgi:hypothetical protein